MRAWPVAAQAPGRETTPPNPATGAGPTTCALHLQRPRGRSRPGRNSNPRPQNRPPTIPSPAQDRPLARCTCNVQGDGPDPFATPTPGHRTAPRPSRHRRGTDHSRVAPATSKGTVLARSQLQPPATEQPPDHPVTGAGPTTRALHLQRPRVRSWPGRNSNPWRRNHPHSILAPGGWCRVACSFR
jgi:hypothetical protein